MRAGRKRSRKKLLGCGCLGVIVAVAGVSVAAAIGFSGVDGSASIAPEPVAPTPSADDGRAPAVFLSVVDGDTIKTDAGTVRIIGIDTPERGECGFATASSAIAGLIAAGDEISLELPEGQHDTDRHDRLLRYVVAHDHDLGLLQLTAGNAVARFDSTDGYPKHPRKAAYHEAQIATLDADGTVRTAECAASEGSELVDPAALVQPTEPIDSDSWWTQYPSCAALARNTVGHPVGPFDVNTPDDALLYEWFAHQTGNRGDGDGDGLACE